MFIMNTHCVQRCSPLQLVFDLFETRAILLLSGDTKAFALVERDATDVTSDLLQLRLVQMEQ